MTIAVLPEQDRQLTIVSTVMNEIVEHGRPDFEYHPESPVVRCSSCNTLFVDGAWMDSLDAHAQGLLRAEANGKVRVSYGICRTVRRQSRTRPLSPVCGKQGIPIHSLA